MAGWVEGIRRALALGLVLIAGTAIEQAPSVGPPIRDVASRMPTPPILTWIPSHIGIAVNETADRAARQALLKPAIDTYLPPSKARARHNIKQTARGIYETLQQLYPLSDYYHLPHT